MPHFKDENSGIHFLSEEDIADGWLELIPDASTWVMISDEEKDAILNPPRSLDDLKASRVAEVDAKVSALFAVGYAHGMEQHIALDEGSRADMTAMATTAIAAATGSVAWPESYQVGWITLENTRIALATPADGLTLAAAVGDYYAKIRQHGRDLKDEILAAADEAALEAIDIEAGWPA